MKKLFSDLELDKITDNKLFWKTIKPLLSDKCIHSSTISLVDNKNVISDDSELAKTFNSYFEKTVIELRIKEYESFDMNLNSRSQDNVDIAINEYENHPSTKIISEIVSFESRFSFKEYKSSHRGCSVTKGVLENFTKFTGKPLYQSLFLISCRSQA